MTDRYPILVAGVSGNFARRVVTHLLDTHRVPAQHIVGTTRSPQRVRDLEARGVTIRRADYAEPESIQLACTGVARAFFTPTMLDPAPGRTRGEVQVDAVQAAIAAGVPHLFYASAPAAERDVPAWWHLDHHQTERAIIDGAESWTVLRNWEWPTYYYHWFGWKEALESGTYPTFTGQSGTSFVSRDDCAAAAAGALVSPTSRNRRFDLTGPAVVSTDEVFAVVHRVTGRTVQVRHCDEQEWEATCRTQGRSERQLAGDRARALMQIGGWYAGLSDGVEELTGRPPMALEPGLRQIIAQQ